MLQEFLSRLFDWHIIIVIVIVGLLTGGCAVYMAGRMTPEEKEQILVYDIIRSFTGVKLTLPLTVKDIWR